MGRLRDHAIQIWNAGVDSVRARPLIERKIKIVDDTLHIDHHCWSRNEFDRVIVVGAGKAGTAMAEGLLKAMGQWCPVVGWVNVPEGTEKQLRGVTVHAARPAGVNEPTQAGVEGTRQMLQLVRDAGSRDLCIALISGGGSALMPAPANGITLQDKLQVTRFLSGAGADITELNAVRKRLSSVKGGGLLRACNAGELVTLVLSDVLGDPLDMIASGPTVPDSSTAQDAIDVLRRFDTDKTLPSRVYDALSRSAASASPGHSDCKFTTLVVGNNALAVDEAGICAEQLGYNHVMHSATSCEGAAEDVGRHLADMTVQMIAERQLVPTRTNCLITGGEPTVALAPADQRGLGGRNQQLVLAAYLRVCEIGLTKDQWDAFCILSGGTDGEDGPTDAAGAVLDAEVHQQATARGLDAADYLRRNDAYTFFDQVGGLLRTGPTGTNVCDVRVAVSAT